MAVDCGSQVFLCDVPLRFDTYSGCSHLCKYCFTYRKQSKETFKPKVCDSVNSLIRFANGGRISETKWCDWDIPIHWGGMSDPFQPLEKTERVSLECLRWFVKSQYPFIVSTKGELIAESEYSELLSKANCVLQISMISSKYDKLESGAPSFKRRLEIVKQLAPKVKRLNIRIQPYILEALDDVIDILPLYAEYGVYGIVVEGMKFFKKKKGLVKIGGDYCYPVSILEDHFKKIREKAHSLGLKFYCGENRLRNMGDDLCCCGIDGLEGFKGNKANANHYLHDKENFIYTEKMREKKTGGWGISLSQSIKVARVCREKSYKEIMDVLFKTKTMISAMLKENIL